MDERTNQPTEQTSTQPNICLLSFLCIFVLCFVYFPTHKKPFRFSLFRCTSMNVIRDPYSTNRPGLVSIIPDVSPTPVRPPLAPLSQLQENAFPGLSFIAIISQSLPFTSLLFDNYRKMTQQYFLGPRDSRSLPLNNRLSSRSVSQDSVYTILIRLPPDGGSGDERAPSIKMIQDDVPLALTHPPRRPLPTRDSDLGDVKLNLDG